jgi:hypothetical protein
MASMSEQTTRLWRSIGGEELELIEQSGMRAFPPQLPEEPIFYPVLSEDYAVEIARDWSVPASGSGFVTQFEVKSCYLAGYAVQEAGSRAHLEYWIHSAFAPTPPLAAHSGDLGSGHLPLSRMPGRP